MLNQRLRLIPSSLEDLEEVVVMVVREAMAVVLEAMVEVMAEVDMEDSTDK